MLRPLFAAAVVVVAALAAGLGGCDAHLTESCTGGACGGNAATGTDASKCAPTPQSGDFPCDVFAVIHHNCNRCHQMPPKNGAPFPLLTYADTQQEYATGFLVFQQMFVSTGPNGDPRMPFGGMLAPADYELLHGWLGQCAPPVPAGSGCGCPGTGCD